MDPVSHGASAGAHPERLSFRFFIHELQHYLHLERGLPHTFVDLLIRPGSVLQGYFDGSRRREYTNPIAYGLLAAAASLIAFSTYQKAYLSWMRGQMTTVTPAGMPDGFFQAYMENIVAVTQRSAVTSFLLAVPLALSVWLLFRSARFNLAEAFAFAFYAVGTYLFVYAIGASPIVYAAQAWTFAQYSGFALQVIVPLWLGLRLFGGTVSNVLKLLLAVGASAFVGYMVIVVGVVAYTVATMH
ncbi:MAG TPA: DUF3667 domain-containing protein [Lysobacter sp.]|nr:DUF3667 domain-containing protein [Lysobacter sp.]